jgi:porin
MTTLSNAARVNARCLTVVSTATLVLLFAIAGSSWAGAQGAAADAAALEASGIPQGSLATNFPANGDADGRRKALADKGITYGLNYVGEWQGVVAGGQRRGGVYIGRAEGILDVDLEKRFGLQGLRFHANVFNIHGKGLTPDYVGSLMPASFIEAKATTRLSEAWLEQKFFGGLANVRMGQLAADVEFATSSYATQFINGTLGWPASHASNLPSGGPAYPFATPGVRLKIDPNKNSSLLFAVFNGDPAGPGSNDPQIRNRTGLNFRLRDQPLAMTEAQFRVNQDAGAKGLAGSYKIGAFGHFGSFDDQRFGSDGRSLGDPTSNGLPAKRRGNHGVYGVIDQQLWRPSSGEPDKGIGVFVRATASPADRNLVDLYFDGGIAFAGLVAARPDDILSFGAAYARISSGARGLDADALAFSGAGLVRRDERLFEINYQAQIVAGWQMDLDLQRVMTPGGNVADPYDPAGRAIPSATILTLHNSFKY